MKAKIISCKLMQGLFLLAVIGPAMMVAAPATGQIQTSQQPFNVVRQNKFILKTRQTILEDKINDTGNPIDLTYNAKAETKLDTKETQEQSTEANKIKKFQVQSTVNISYGAGSGSANMNSDFETTVKNFYRTGRETNRSSSTTRDRNEKQTIAPGKPIFLARNTVSGGGFEISYETNKRMDKPPPDVEVTVTITTDLNPPFNELMDLVTHFAPRVPEDRGEWNHYAGICSDARIKGIQEYIDRVLYPKTGLWTNGLDQYSWKMVREAASKARVAIQENKNADALSYILLGFNKIQRPSHNGHEWRYLRDLGQRLVSGK